MESITNIESVKRLVSPDEAKHVTMARQLCEQARFVESKRKELMAERQILIEESEKLLDVLDEVSSFVSRAFRNFQNNSSELMGLSDKLSEIADRLSGGEQPETKNNVRLMFDTRPDQTGPLLLSTCDAGLDVQSFKNLSASMLCRQAKYIVVYLDRAIKLHDDANLPRLIEDLERISRLMSSEKIHGLSSKLAIAAASADWRQIDLIHKVIVEELEEFERSFTHNHDDSYLQAS